MSRSDNTRGKKSKTRKQKGHVKKRKTKKQIERMYLASGFNRHHRRPKAKGGNGQNGNLSWVPVKAHKYYHALFHIGFPVRRRVVRPLNERWLDVRYLTIDGPLDTVVQLYELLSRYEGYVDPAIVPYEELVTVFAHMQRLVDYKYSLSLAENLDLLGVTKAHQEYLAVRQKELNR